MQTHETSSSLLADEIDLIALTKVIWGGRSFICVLTLIFVLLSAIYAFNSEPTFQADVLLAPAGKKGKQGGISSLAGQFGGLASLAGVNLSSDDDTEKSLAILKSRVFLTNIVKTEGLPPILFEEQWNEDISSWDRYSPSLLSSIKCALFEQCSEKPEYNVPSVGDSYDAFKSLIGAAVDEKTGLVTLSIQWKDPEQASNWANMLVDKLNHHIKHRDVEEAKKSIAYLKEQLKTTSVAEMQNVLFKLIESQIQTIMLANVRDGYVFAVIDPATVPERSIKPKKALIVVFGGVFGFMLAVVIILVRSKASHGE